MSKNIKYYLLNKKYFMGKIQQTFPKSLKSGTGR